MRTSWTLALILSTSYAITCPPRVRRPWGSLTTDEQQLYVNAVALAMQKGYHHKFVEVHDEVEGVYEAHSCTFFYWHRKFLLAYETMLRSLGDQYSCITIPYWDYATLSDGFQANTCTDFASCASSLHEAFGGSKAGKGINATINGDPITADSCVSNFPLNNFCESSKAYDTNTCMKCLPRNDWSTSVVPAELNAQSIANQILGSKSVNDCNDGVQLGSHNMLHFNLGGAMASFESPADPVFYIHHSTVDLMHRIFYKCNVGRPLADVELANPDVYIANNERLWPTCPRWWSDNTNIKPSDTVTFKVGQFDAALTITDDPSSPLYPFFKGLPNQYYQYIDADALGNFSYSYVYAGRLADLFVNCTLTPGLVVNSSIAPIYQPPTPTPAPTPAPTRAVPKAVPRTNAPTLAPTTKTTSMLETIVYLDEASERHGNVKRIYKYENRVYERPRKVGELKEMTWAEAINSNAKYHGVKDEEMSTQIELILCMHHHECHGGCYDFDKDFKKAFHPKGPPRCARLVKDLYHGAHQIRIPNWRALTHKHFPCVEEAPPSIAAVVEM
ncbi:hypothetical protein THRCLA_07141 [Thraustotheca clavata]|uniref:Tyrosinase copper-binding domain-containing protein n=1 Tax=Thraustotheca clavata TaxID=74557 RepID=A0A1V9ZFX4_9STRA|nr:hypothetical protein THRCLA_07141 [Thraustotheca clavata]